MALSLAEHVAAEVRAEMARQRYNQRKLAEVLGLSQAQVSDRMRGEVEFKISELEQIARVLRVPFTHFLPADASRPGEVESSAAAA